MRHCSVISSLTASKGMTQASLVYLYTALVMRGIQVDLYDLSGTISYFDAPVKLSSSCSSDVWMNLDCIKQGRWMDDYLSSVNIQSSYVLFSALFSPDVVFHSRLSYRIKINNPNVVTAIGGNVFSGLEKQQIDFLSNFFDYILIGHNVVTLIDLMIKDMKHRKSLGKNGIIIKAFSVPSIQPDYSLVHLENFVTVYTGHGCYYGKCNFCDIPIRTQGSLTYRSIGDVVKDLIEIRNLHPSVENIMLSQDCYTQEHVIRTAKNIQRYLGFIPYNLMLRAEPWLDSGIGKLLMQSGCTDVFIGVEALDNRILSRINKGINISNIEKSIKSLSEYVNITIGLVLFVPDISKDSLDCQLITLERLIPYIYSIEPEVLTIVKGSFFSKFPERYGIVLNATENVLNDSWCFGLSQDIPWTMKDYSLIEKWMEHIEKLYCMCAKLVKDEYWAAIKNLRQRLHFK